MHKDNLTYEEIFWARDAFEDLFFKLKIPKETTDKINYYKAKIKELSKERQERERR